MIAIILKDTAQRVVIVSTIRDERPLAYNKPMSITFVIVTHNNEQTIEVCLKSVQQQKVGEILIVDSASSDNTTAKASKLTGCEIINIPKNVGFGRGNNIGIHQALKKKPDYILILNPDVILKKEALSKLLKAAAHKNSRSISR